MALDAEVGGTASNSYVAQAVATTYLTDRLPSASLATWTAASTGDKDAALITATRRLDTESFIGSPVFVDQALKWPRNGAYDDDGRSLSSATIPLLVQHATIEYAYVLVGEPTQLDNTGLEGFVNVKVGSLDVTPRAVGAAQLPAFIKRLLAPLRLGGFGTVVTRA